MADPAKKRATYEDVLNAPPNTVAQILFGTLHVMPRPRVRHAEAASELGSVVREGFGKRRGGRGPGGWVILDEPELHLGSDPDVVVPDIAGWRRDRMPRPPDVAAIEMAPDWVCEILSPGTQHIDRGDKMTIYAREGVSYAWLVDPEERLLEVYRLIDTQWTRISIHSRDARVRAEPFDAIEIDLDLLWLEESPAPAEAAR